MANALQEPVSADDLLSDLTSERSAVIAEAQQEGRIFIQQPYERYSDENHRSWGQLYRRMQPRWERYANNRFLEGLDRLHLDADCVPHLEDVNRFLAPLTGFTTRPVSGFVPAFLFFDCLHRREFPTTVTIRDGGAAFAPWPDIFHDITGHVPMHTDPAFADALVRFVDCAHTAVARTAGIKDREEKIHKLSNMIRAMARFFWFTVETGLMREGNEIKVYGSAMLSSYGEIEHCLDTSLVQQYPIQLEWVINQSFLPNYYQPLLFIVDSFSHLYDLVDQLERWMREGRLDNVAPGEPGITEEDLQSFLDYAEK